MAGHNSADMRVYFYLSAYENVPGRSNATPKVDVQEIGPLLAALSAGGRSVSVQRFQQVHAAVCSNNGGRTVLPLRASDVEESAESGEKLGQDVNNPNMEVSDLTEDSDLHLQLDCSSDSAEEAGDGRETDTVCPAAQNGLLDELSHGGLSTEVSVNGRLLVIGPEGGREDIIDESEDRPANTECPDDALSSGSVGNVVDPDDPCEREPNKRIESSETSLERCEKSDESNCTVESSNSSDGRRVDESVEDPAAMEVADCPEAGLLADIKVEPTDECEGERASDKPNLSIPRIRGKKVIGHIVELPCEESAEVKTETHRNQHGAEISETVETFTSGNGGYGDRGSGAVGKRVEKLTDGRTCGGFGVTCDGESLTVMTENRRGPKKGQIHWKRRRKNDAPTRSQTGSSCKENKQISENSSTIRECKFCNKSFGSTNSLKKHLRVHSGGKCLVLVQPAREGRTDVVAQKDKKPYTCHVCGKSFVRPSRLKLHSLKHDGEKTVKCSVCETFFRAGLKVHKLVRGEKTYKCQSCDKNLRSHANQKQHLETHRSKT